jgi:alanyl-tRNA synthetase
MGFERIVSVLQGVDSNYKIDLFKGALDVVRSLTGEDEQQMYTRFTPYRVIADHARAAAFLIADGVVPGNTGRNYICRMIIRRAARFGTKIDLHEPFLARVAEAIIASYGDFYPELVKSRQAIADNLTREEARFARTIEFGQARLADMIGEILRKNKPINENDKLILDGRKAFELYATYGLPFEITRDILRESDYKNLDVDETGFRVAMDEHRIASGGGKAMGRMGGEDAEFYIGLLKNLQKAGKLGKQGVEYNPYEWLQVEGPLLALTAGGQVLTGADAGDRVEVLLPKTGFYVESGGQVSDTGFISSLPKYTGTESDWQIEITEMRKPAAGVIVHVGEVVFGHPKPGDSAVGEVDEARRHDIRRNHTATHLLHAALHQVLGESARQAGSLVAPDRFRFDFNHPEAMTPEQIERVERIVNAAVAADYPVKPVEKSRQQAVAEGAMALFGEKYGETVRTITIGDPERRYSYELCGGTHLDRTSDVGAFIILSEGSAAAGIRRIEAVTGRGAYELIARRFKALKQAAGLLSSTPEAIPEKVESLQGELSAAKKEIAGLRQEGAVASFIARLADVPMVRGVPVLTLQVPNADADTLRQLADRFRQKYTSGTAVLGSVIDGRPTIIASVTEDLVKRGLNAGELVKFVAAPLGGSGGGKPTLAQAGGKDASKLEEALASVPKWVEEKLK